MRRLKALTLAAGHHRGLEGDGERSKATPVFDCGGFFFVSVTRSSWAPFLQPFASGRPSGMLWDPALPNNFSATMPLLSPWGRCAVGAKIDGMLHSVRVSPHRRNAVDFKVGIFAGPRHRFSLSGRGSRRPAAFFQPWTPSPYR